ncbi:MAG: GHKL domain-containing protein [Lachnospiraceae bacterium]|jgi:hypothetical protein|nr:GHKL domain-containing protein [Lachnospiraceae bacterium]
MDCFGLCFDAFCLIIQSVMHMIFVSRLTGQRQRTVHIAVYLCLVCLTSFICYIFSIPGFAAIGAQFLILYGINRLAFGNRPPSSCVASLLAVYIYHLSFGIINSIEMLVLPPLIGTYVLYAVLLLSTGAAFFICAFGYTAVLKLLSLKADSQTPYIGLVLLPGLFFFTAELYILHTSYSPLSAAFRPFEAGSHGMLLFLQSLGLGALFCTLYAYRHLCLGFQAQAALLSLTQATQAQRTYIAEAKTRYEQTKAFRHDIKNHLAVLNALLEKGQLSESRDYLKKLETVSSSLSFPCQTGNPVVDILLSEKLGMAKADGIGAKVSLLLPVPCGIDDVDLCVIFSNALDNAIHACRAVREDGFIHISGERQGDFYMLIFQNSCSHEPLPPMGTGLSNIRSVARKYHGAMLTEKKEGVFTLNVLLNTQM